MGRPDIRKLEFHSQDDPDAYSYSGALNLTTQGLLEFVEMFKAPQKMLHPLLTATQERNYVGSENLGAMPYQGIIMAHSNESEWRSFKANRNNEAFLDRISLIRVPYCLRVDEEAKIYRKLMAQSELAEAPCAPDTLEMMARFSVLTRLKPHENSIALRQDAGLQRAGPEGQRPARQDGAGVPRRGRRRRRDGRHVHPLRLQGAVGDVQLRHGEVAADPVHLMYVLEQAIRREQLDRETEQRYIALIKEELAPRYADYIGKEIQKAYLESYEEYGQNLFDRYIAYADAWVEGQDFKDPTPGRFSISTCSTASCRRPSARPASATRRISATRL